MKISSRIVRGLQFQTNPGRQESGCEYMIVSYHTWFLRFSIPVLSRHKTAYPTERKSWVTWQQTNVTSLKILDSFRNHNQRTQIIETKSAKCLLWCNDKNTQILQPSTISIKMNSTEVFILEIKKHPSELFISFSDFRGDSMVQHSLL